VKVGVDLTRLIAAHSKRGINAESENSLAGSDDDDLAMVSARVAYPDRRAAASRGFVVLVVIELVVGVKRRIGSALGAVVAGGGHLRRGTPARGAAPARAVPEGRV
jgi:hypothetical protein